MQGLRHYSIKIYTKLAQGKPFWDPPVSAASGIFPMVFVGTEIFVTNYNWCWHLALEAVFLGNQPHFLAAFIV